MQIVEIRIVFRACAHRWSAERNRQIVLVGAAADVVDLRPLDVHTADEDRICPDEIVIGRGGNVFVKEADFPASRERCRNQKQTLRRHKGLNAVGQGVSVFKSAE